MDTTDNSVSVENRQQKSASSIPLAISNKRSISGTLDVNLTKTVNV